MESASGVEYLGMSIIFDISGFRLRFHINGEELHCNPISTTKSSFVIGIWYLEPRCSHISQPHSI